MLKIEVSGHGRPGRSQCRKRAYGAQLSGNSTGSDMGFITWSIKLAAPLRTLARCPFRTLALFC